MSVLSACEVHELISHVLVDRGIQIGPFGGGAFSDGELWHLQ